MTARFGAFAAVVASAQIAMAQSAGAGSSSPETLLRETIQHFRNLDSFVIEFARIDETLHTRSIIRAGVHYRVEELANRVAELYGPTLLRSTAVASSTSSTTALALLFIRRAPRTEWVRSIPPAKAPPRRSRCISP
jgi:hypothetical protein